MNRFLVILFVIFLFFQIFFVILNFNELLYTFTIFHFFSLFIFIFSFILLLKINENYLFFFIFIYQATFVLIHFYFYMLYYNNLFGYNPADALFYNNLGLQFSNLNFFQLMDYVNKNLSVGDYGFSFLLWVVYKLDSHDILLMKLFNIIFIFFSSFMFNYIVIKLIDGKVFQKYTILFFALNPYLIYYSSSGLKEPFFIFIILSAFYFFVRGYDNSKLNYFLSLGLMIITGFFRVYFPFLIGLSFLSFWISKKKGFYGFITKGILLLAVFLIFVSVYTLLSSELNQKLNYNISSIASYRLGRVPTYIDYILLFIGGILGPYPSFAYKLGDDINLLETVGNFIKISFSSFFLIGLINVFYFKLNKFYPFIILLVINILIVSVLGLSLDPRFSVVIIFSNILLVVLGITKYYSNKKKYNSFIIISTLLVYLLVFLYNFR